ncbi:hypothetical protein EUTSA_v10015993mg [Eutrema salsugineum]|uniref:F-box domain-containing protein n=1 Tax=Eutrema salsugineum TaxID=72664 RepID=V4LHW7_EUTSA|nr:hypothetical protein EUTSA_v10015993mg [Eutrema salsugineum]
MDIVSSLPESLIFEILLNLSTKDVVKTSLLSSRWRNLWRFVPGLSLEYSYFRKHDAFVSFVDAFLGFNSDSCMQKFKLKCNWDYVFKADVKRWIDTVAKRRIQHLHVADIDWEDDEMQIPPTIYTCESLVSLNIYGITLPTLKFVSLPCLKAIVLDTVKFSGDSALETLILGCPVLERLYIERNLCDYTEVLRVRSQSLLSFTIIAYSHNTYVEDLVVAIDAPRLKYLRLCDHRTASFLLNNMGSLVKADIDSLFNLLLKMKFDPNDIQKRNMIRDFLAEISGVKDLIIVSRTLEVIYEYSRCEPLPLFRNLSFLRVEFGGYRCSNLKSLVVGSITYEESVGIDYIVPESRCFLASLEYVEIERRLEGEAMEMELVSYLLENSPVLKKLTLCLDRPKKKKECVILKELLTIPRLSVSCQVVVL